MSSYPPDVVYGPVDSILGIVDKDEHGLVGHNHVPGMKVHWHLRSCSSTHASHVL